MILQIPQQLAQQLNLPVDLIKTVIILLVNIILAPVFFKIHSTNLRYWYSLTLGLIFTFYIVQIWGLYVLATSLVPFLAIRLFPKYPVSIALTTSFFFLLFIHCHRFMYDFMSWKIDCSVIVMYQIPKVTYFADAVKKGQAKLEIMPYLSYCFFFPGIAIGPVFSFQTFTNFIQRNNSKAFPSISYILKSFAKAIIFTVITFNALRIFTPYWIIQNQTFIELPSYIQFLSLNIIGFFYRVKFYFAWSVAQLAIDLSGISWDQKTNSHDLVECGSVKFEAQLNPKLKTQYWNTSIQIWLKDMLFKVFLQRTKSQQIATMLTFLSSAFWHGIYLTYYIGFIQWACIIIVTKWGYKCSLAIPKISQNIILKMLAFLIGSSLINYTGMFISILTMKQAMKSIANQNYLGHYLLLLLLLMSFVIKPKMLKPLNKKK